MPPQWADKPAVLSPWNRRLTFRVGTAEGEICDLNLEDYH